MLSRRAKATVSNLPAKIAHRELEALARAMGLGADGLLLEVHPFELTLGREVVYLERDR